MKLSIHAILYLLCASVVSGQYAEATDNAIERQQEVNIVGFVKKCHEAVRAIWASSIGTRNYAEFEDDLIDALAYVELNSRSWHQLTWIQEPLVKALYDKMKEFSYDVPNGSKKQPIDMLIKAGKVKYYISDSVDGLSRHDIWCARLLCGIAAKIFWNCEKSIISLEHITKIEKMFNNANSKNGEEGVVLTAENLERTLNKHLAQKKMDIGQIGEKGNIVLSDIRGVNHKDYVQGYHGGKAFLSFDASIRNMNKDGVVRNTHEYIVPIPKSDQEYKNWQTVVNVEPWTNEIYDMIDNIEKSDLTEEQKKSIHVLKSAEKRRKDAQTSFSLTAQEKEVYQKLKTLVDYYYFTTIYKTMGLNGISDLKRPDEETLEAQAKHEIRLAEKLNPQPPMND